MVELRRLEWDSEFFGFDVWRADLGAGDADISLLRNQLRAAGFRMCYLFAHDASGAAAAKGLGAVLVDRRTLLRLKVDAAGLSQPQVGEIFSADDADRLRELALQSGQLSRFKLDARIPPGMWMRLYETWIESSISSEIADAVLVERLEGRIVAMITLKDMGEEGAIGLFAVEEAARGKGLGKALMARAECWFRSRGCAIASVVTQGDNEPALRLYQSAGYEVVEVTYVYHLWR